MYAAAWTSYSADAQQRLFCNSTRAQPPPCSMCPVGPCVPLRCVLQQQPVYGFNSKDPAKFLRVAPHSELMYVQDPEVTFNQVRCGAEVFVLLCVRGWCGWWLCCYCSREGACTCHHTACRAGQCARGSLPEHHVQPLHTPSSNNNPDLAACS